MGGRREVMAWRWGDSEEAAVTVRGVRRRCTARLRALGTDWIREAGEALEDISWLLSW